MTSTNKKLEPKKSYIRLLDKKQIEDSNDKIASHSNEKQTTRHGNSGSKRKKSKDTMKDLLKQSYIFVREENESLSHKLRKKNKKIQEMKEIIKQYDRKIKDLQSIIYPSKEAKPQITKESQELLKNSRKQYEQMARQSQDVAKKSIERYRKLQKQMDQLKNCSQQQIQALKNTNRSLKIELKQLKNTNKSIQNTTDRKKNKSYHVSSKKDLEIDMWTELKDLREKQITWMRKEEELKRMLNQITSKINNFEINCRNTQAKAKQYKFELQELQQRYDKKCRKQKDNNEKWGAIFRDFMKETQSLGKDISTIKNVFYNILKKEIAKQERM